MDELKSSKDLEQAFLKWNKLLYNYAYLRVQNRGMTEDIVQEVFMKAWRSRETFDYQKSSLKNWLFAITINTINDFLRNKIRYNVEELQEFYASDEDLEEDANKKALIEIVFKKIKLLTDREQELLLLRYKADLAVEDIAQMLEMEYSATKVAIHRAIKKLIKFLNNM